MNREIEFRAWLKESLLEKNGYYKYESYKEKIDKLGRMRKVHSIHLNKESIIISSAWGGNIGVYFDGVELMQYTGLKDKNGVKIFEGDIVKAIGYPAIEVIYDEESCSFKMKVQYEGWFDLLNLSLNKTPHLEVIGNIYENKELLENE